MQQSLIYLWILLQIMEVTEFPVSYLPGNVIRIQVKAVGDIRYKDHPGGVKWKGGVTVGALISPTVAKSGKIKRMVTFC